MCGSWRLDDAFYHKKEVCARYIAGMDGISVYYAERIGGKAQSGLLPIERFFCILKQPDVALFVVMCENRNTNRLAIGRQSYRCFTTSVLPSVLMKHWT